MHGTLTPEDVAYAVECVVRHVEDRWIERGILAAPDDATALHVAKDRAGQGASCGGQYAVDWMHGRIEVRAADREGFLSFCDLVCYVRHGLPRPEATQLSLNFGP